jgi:uncharacterized protein YecE (DUF72 family)
VLGATRRVKRSAKRTAVFLEARGSGLARHVPDVRAPPDIADLTLMPTRTASTLPAPDLDPAHDPGFAAASSRAERALAATSASAIGQPLRPSTPSGEVHEVYVGTASWTDPTMVRGNVFYPRGVSSAEDRLRYYAEQFPVVEVDSSYYSLPERANALRWAERTPPHFTFHLKAHALMTGQPTEVARLPVGLVEAMPRALAAKPRVYAKDLPLELVDAVWTYFMDAVAPLSEVGKLGGVLLQYPRWFLPTPANKDLLAEAATRLAGIPASVELRNRLWFNSPRSTEWTLDMLRELGLTHVVVDGPQGMESSVPAVAAVTTPRLAVVRLHGRRAATWEAAKVPTVERYRYLYSPEELEATVPLIESTMEKATRTTIFFNNCYGNYGATNAREMIARLA